MGRAGDPQEPPRLKDPAALAATRAGARVLLLDRADFPRDKPCGDGIAAEAVDVLADLGLTGVTDGYPPVHRLRLVSPGGDAMARPLPRPVHTVPRRVFDARLVEAAVQQGAVLGKHTVREVRDGAPLVAAVLLTVYAVWRTQRTAVTPADAVPA